MKGTFTTGGQYLVRLEHSPMLSNEIALLGTKRPKMYMFLLEYLVMEVTQNITFL